MDDEVTPPPPGILVPLPPPPPPPRAPPRPAPWRPLNACLLALLMGTRSPNSPLYLLRGGLCRALLPKIWGYYDAFIREAIVYDKHAYVQLPRNFGDLFPKPDPRQLVDISMMPFLVGMRGSLPEHLRKYWAIIGTIPFGPEDEKCVAYLTIQESQVDAGKTQRRCGLHTESPGFWAHNLTPSPPKFEHFSYGSWGGGYTVEEPTAFYGGIFMIAHPYGFCRLWKCRVDPTVVGPLGDCEHLRPWLKSHLSDVTSGGNVYWITDLTPHEVLPSPYSGMRQYIRVVTKGLSEWYADHYTANPVGIQPACPIVYGSKFANVITAGQRISE